MQDRKLTYYQDLSNNTQFVEAYLIAVKSIVSSDRGLFGAMPQMIIELSGLLFSHKPLIPEKMQRTHQLLELAPINSRLVQTNQAIIAQASGKIATKLLSFLQGPRKTKELVQLANVCAALRKPGEAGSPVYDQALSRAATWGRLFELNVLIKAMPKPDLNKTDPTYKRTALHFAASNKNVDCVRALIHAEASLDIQDADGQTPLDKAVINGDRHMIKVLIEAGSSIDIPDKMNHQPSECAPDQGTIAFIQDCHSHLHFSNLRISA